MKLIVATPFYEMKGFSPYISSLVATTRMLCKMESLIDGFEWDFWDLSQDSYVDRARNAIANRFMASKYTDLVFIDSDEKWDLEGFANLLKSDADVVGAGYPCKNNWDFYGCILNDDDGRPITNDQGLLSAYIVPSGFIKIRRPVFERLRDAQPDDFYFAQEREYLQPEKFYNFYGRIPPLGEDGSFCQRWREAGGTLWVQPNVTITHYGMKGWTGNYHEELQRYPGGAKEGLPMEISSRRVLLEPRVGWMNGLKLPPQGSAWKGMELIMPDLLERFCKGRDKALEFGVDYGYSTAVLSQLFKQVVGVDTFRGDIHSGHRPDYFAVTAQNLAEHGNIQLQQFDYKEWIRRDQELYDLIHIDIVHTEEDTYQCGRWAVHHAPVVIFHDTESFPAVHRAVGRIAHESGRTF